MDCVLLKNEQWVGRSFALAHAGVSFVQFDNLRIVSASEDGTVKIWDLQSGVYQGSCGAACL
jgi:WD40 repeat protein